MDYHFKRKSYILRFLEIKENLLNIKSNINEIDPINLKRINYMIDDTINLIDFYDWSKKTIEQMQIDLDDMLHNFEILREGQKSVTKNYKEKCF